MAGADASRVLTFAAAGQTLAIEAASVAEVTAMPRVTRVPQAPAALIGVANLRGRVAPILSVEALLGVAATGGASRVIVLDRAEPIGLAGDRIEALRDGSGGDAVLSLGEDGAVRRLDLDALLPAAFKGGLARTRIQTSHKTLEAVRSEEAADEIAFLQFEVAGQAYALPLEQVREVTPLPADTTALPRTDEAMVGVMPLRGGLIALVSLRAVLGLPRPSEDLSPQVVVAALGDATVGLLVDRVRAILRAREPDVGAVPAVLNRGAGEARIDAIVRTPGGLVSVLATERILQEESVAQIIADGAGRSVDRSDDRGQAGGATEQFVLFRLGEETYGLPISAVVEVVRLPETVARAPRAPDFVAGVMNHRGTVIPLIDQRRRFLLPGEADAGRRVIVTRLGEVTAGFIVDRVERILSLDAATLQATPDLASGETPLFDRIATLDVDGRLVLLVDPQQLLDQAERDLIRAMAEPGAPETP